MDADRGGESGPEARVSRFGPGLWVWRLSVPLLILVVAVGMLVGSSGIDGRDAFYPRVLAAVVTAFALYAIVRDAQEFLAERRGTTGSDTEPESIDNVPDAGVEGRGGVGVAARRVVALCAVAVVSVWLIEWVGYYIASAVLLAGGAFVLGVRSPLKVAIYTCALIGVAYLLFGLLLGVPLPRPLWS